MLKKLLKYDLKDIYKILLIFYSLVIIFSIFTRIFFSFDNSLIFNIIGEICSGVMISMMASVLINNLMRSWARFYINIYKDESYLTHTLPVTKKQIYLSKLLASLITMFSSVLVILLGIFIAYYSKENMLILKEILQLMASTYNSTVIGLLLVISLVFFLEMMNVLLCGYTGILIGHRSNNKRMGKSVLYGFILFIFSQGLMLLISYIIGLFNSDIMMIFTSNTINDINIIKKLMYIVISIYTLFIFIYYFIDLKIFNKGVNVD